MGGTKAKLWFSPCNQAFALWWDKKEILSLICFCVWGEGAYDAYGIKSSSPMCQM